MVQAFNQVKLPLHIGDFRSLARCISLVENQVEGTEDFMQKLPASTTQVIGVTGPPGAGKSTLVDGLIGTWIAQNHSVAVLCVDPSSPFNLGAVLGDRIRMNAWYNHPKVYIRSLATRGSLGGLHPYIIEITDVLKAAGFTRILVETVGVGQSEIEIAGLADCSVVVLVPEAGDEIQTMKAGLMEIADVFVVNKADRPEAEKFTQNLHKMLAPAFAKNEYEIAIVQTTATSGDGIEQLSLAIDKYLQHNITNDRKYWLLADKAYHIIAKHRMQGISKQQLKTEIMQEPLAGFNLYSFTQKIIQELG